MLNFLHSSCLLSDLLLLSSFLFKLPNQQIISKAQLRRLQFLNNFTAHICIFSYICQLLLISQELLIACQQLNLLSRRFDHLIGPLVLLCFESEDMFGFLLD